jgi:hypothetical protein
MIKELNVTAPLRKEMSDLVEKARMLPFGSEDWVAANARWNELLILWANHRIDGMEKDLTRARF